MSQQLQGVLVMRQRLRPEEGSLIILFYKLKYNKEKRGISASASCARLRDRQGYNKNYMSIYKDKKTRHLCLGVLRPLLRLLRPPQGRRQIRLVCARARLHRCRARLRVF